MSLHQSVVTNGKDGRGLKLEKKKKKAKFYCCACKNQPKIVAVIAP